LMRRKFDTRAHTARSHPHLVEVRGITLFSKRCPRGNNDMTTPKTTTARLTSPSSIPLK